MKTFIDCPYCGEKALFTLKVRDGDGQRIACQSCQHEKEGEEKPNHEPTGQRDDFLREVMTYKGTGQY